MCKYFRPKNKTLIRGILKEAGSGEEKTQYRCTKIGILTGVIANSVALESSL